jgi:hypothetical protein
MLYYLLLFIMIVYITFGSEFFSPTSPLTLNNAMKPTNAQGAILDLGQGIYD